MPKAKDRRGRPARPSGAGSPPERAHSSNPGHMQRTRGQLVAVLKQVDLVLELRDARLPVGSANPELETLLGARQRMLLFTKAALADPAATRAWQEHLAAGPAPVLFLDADSPRGIAQILTRARALLQPAWAALRQRGIRPPPARLMVVGIPNVGKSTLINRLAGAHRVATAPVPGVTRHLAWVQLPGELLLLDTPGVLPPRIASEQDALHLTWIGALKPAVVGVQPAALALLAFLLRHYPRLIQADLPANLPGTSPEALLEALARQRGLLAAGGTPNLQAAAQNLLERFQTGAWGRVTLELPPAGTSKDVRSAVSPPERSAGTPSPL